MEREVRFPDPRSVFGDDEEIDVGLAREALEHLQQHDHENPIACGLAKPEVRGVQLPLHDGQAHPAARELLRVGVV